jgi:hypothetical protein
MMWNRNRVTENATHGRGADYLRALLKELLEIFFRQHRENPKEGLSQPQQFLRRQLNGRLGTGPPIVDIFDTFLIQQ